MGLMTWTSINYSVVADGAAVRPTGLVDTTETGLTICTRGRALLWPEIIEVTA